MEHPTNNHYPLVDPIYEREPDSVPGPFYVIRDACIICALPPETAPQNISWDRDLPEPCGQECPDHCRVYRQPGTRQELDQMIEAATHSCVSAIRYCGTDPSTLDRFRKLGEAGLFDALANGQAGS